MRYSGLYFIDALEGTGKIFFISLISATIRSRNHIALIIASFGVAATLLVDYRTAHSVLKLSLNMQIAETPTCYINKISGIRKIMKSCQFTIWNKCTIAH